MSHNGISWLQSVIASSVLSVKCCSGMPSLDKGPTPPYPHTNLAPVQTTGQQARLSLTCVLCAGDMAPNKRGGPLSDKKKAEISGTKPAPASNGVACAHFDEPGEGEDQYPDGNDHLCL